jgi:hypothetical protein
LLVVAWILEAARAERKRKRGRLLLLRFFFVANADFLLEAHVSAERSVQFFSTERTYS